MVQSCARSSSFSRVRISAFTALIRASLHSRSGHHAGFHRVRSASIPDKAVSERLRTNAAAFIVGRGGVAVRRSMVVTDHLGLRFKPGRQSQPPDGGKLEEDRHSPPPFDGDDAARGTVSIEITSSIGASNAAVRTSAPTFETDLLSATALVRSFSCTSGSSCSNGIITFIALRCGLGIADSVARQRENTRKAYFVLPFA